MAPPTRAFEFVIGDEVTFADLPGLFDGATRLLDRHPSVASELRQCNAVVRELRGGGKRANAAYGRNPPVGGHVATKVAWRNTSCFP